MRSCGLLLVAACASDPSLEIAVRHPARSAVRQTTVTLYAGNDISCTQIEFGDLTAAELAALAIDEVDAAGDESLEVGRLGGKSLVARGYDAQHRFITAGCTDLGEIAGATRTEIETQPTAVIAIDPGQAERPFGERTILVNMTDTSGTPIEGMVSWQLTGPVGSRDAPPADGVSTRNGDARIHVDDLGTPGPEGLRIRVPWAIAPLPLVTAFDLSNATTLALPGGALGGHPSCDVRGHAGKPLTLVCLGPATAALHRDVVEIAWQPASARYAVTTLAIPATITNQFALFVDRDPSATDEPVYVISADASGAGSWYQLGDPESMKRPVVFGGALQSVFYIPRCRENSAGPLVGVVTGPAIADALDQTTFFTPGGIKASGPNDGELLSGGCVGDVDGHEHQAVVVAGPNDVAAALVLVTSADTMQPIPGTRLSGAGFVSVEDHGVTEKRFAGTRLQASGTVVFEAVLAPDAGSFKLVERTELDAAAPPTKIIGGKLDQDADTDLMWDVNSGLRRAHVFQVSLARREHVTEEPLTAMTSGAAVVTSTAAAASDFLVGDLTGNLPDEMVTFTANAVTIYSAQ